jgi:GNAT superfamily N-acetyltransferase
MNSKTKSPPISMEAAIETFVQGHCFGKSRTFPYEHGRIDGVWFMRDAVRKNPKDYRKEEWITFGTDSKTVDAIAKKRTRGRYFVCAIVEKEEDGERTKEQYKALGYRLMTTEPMFVHSLARIPKGDSPATIVQVRDGELAKRLGKAAGVKPISKDWLAADSGYRQYAATIGEDVVGWVASIQTTEAAWCWNMYVLEQHRRQGIGAALLEKMLRDLKKLKMTASVLLSSHTGALLYPKVGYEPMGMLYMFVPKRK